MVKVSEILGVAFRPVFLSRYCVPDFQGDSDSGHMPKFIPGRLQLDGTAAEVPPANENSSKRNRGFYRLRYNLEPRVAIDPDAFVRNIPNEGPFNIANMWTDARFHSSML